MKIAIVGTGVSGLVAAHRLAPHAEVELFEAGSHIGGHAHTVDVEVAGRAVSVDTGFMVFNDRTYPNFCRLIDELGVSWRESDMSLGIRCETTGFEYSGSTLSGLFAQRRNLLRPGHWRMLRDVMRFNRLATAAVEQAVPDDLTLGEFVEQCRLGRRFFDLYLTPMSAAIWSAEPATVAHFPARFILGFLAHHGLLTVRDRPVWRTIVGGSRTYVDRITAPFRDSIHLDQPIESIRRLNERVVVRLQNSSERTFDAVVIAAHSDQALSMLDDPTSAEREVLGAIRYQANDCLLHTDDSILPRRRRARASWNCHVLADSTAPVAVTYDIRRLQGVRADAPVLVSLNCTGRIDPAKVLRRFNYSHPVFDHAAIGAQRRYAEVSRGRTFYCGAYWSFGFHEDGVKSGLRAAGDLLMESRRWKAAFTKDTSATVA